MLHIFKNKEILIIKYFKYTGLKKWNIFIVKIIPPKDTED